MDALAESLDSKGFCSRRSGLGSAAKLCNTLAWSIASSTCLAWSAHAGAPHPLLERSRCLRAGRGPGNPARRSSRYNGRSNIGLALCIVVIYNIPADTRLELHYFRARNMGGCTRTKLSRDYRMSALAVYTGRKPERLPRAPSAVLGYMSSASATAKVPVRCAGQLHHEASRRQHHGCAAWPSKP